MNLLVQYSPTQIPLQNQLLSPKPLHPYLPLEQNKTADQLFGILFEGEIEYTYELIKYVNILRLLQTLTVDFLSLNVIVLKQGELQFRIFELLVSTYAHNQVYITICVKILNCHFQLHCIFSDKYFLIFGPIK